MENGTNHTRKAAAVALYLSLSLVLLSFFRYRIHENRMFNAFSDGTTYASTQIIPTPKRVCVCTKQKLFFSWRKMPNMD